MVQVGISASKFLSVLVLNKWDKALMGTESGSQREKAAKKKAAETLQELLTKLGPAFVKLAQTLSMRPDLVGEVYSSALSKLQDNVEPFPNDIAYEILEEELGKPLDQIFISLSPSPVASASIGQVYKGILRPEYGNGGGLVAVKVQRPGSAESIALDIRLLRTMLGMVQRALGTERDLRVLADEVGAGLQGECDFRNEAFNAKEFKRAHASLQFVTTPRMVDGLCTRRVLVSEWVEGRSPTQILTPKTDENGTSVSTSSDVLSLVRMGIQCSLAQLLVTGCMHGDPHSGNLLLTDDGRLCYLDFGLVVRVSARHRQAMMAALVHLGLGEWSRLVDDLAQLDLLKPGTDTKQLSEELEREFTAVIASAEPSTGESPLAPQLTQLPLLSLQTSSLSFSTLAGVLFRVAFKYRFLLPSYFPLVIRSVSSLEGVALSVDPNFKLVAAGMPVVLNQLLSDRRPAAQELLRELLLSPGGALRTDDTTRQILQVWLSAAQQSARAEAISSGSPEEQVAAMSTSSSSSAVDMTSLLLDRRNVPLRRTIIMSNPAETIAKMPQDMRDQLLKVLSEALSSDEGSSAAAELLQRSPAARAQRKRLLMMFKASVPKVMKSSPRSILQLVTFSFAIVFALVQAWRKLLWKKIASWFAIVRSWFGGGKLGPNSA